MPPALLLAANDAEQVAAGLQVFLDHIPQNESDLEGCIEELLALAAAIKELVDQYPDYHVASPRLTADVNLIVSSLGFTLRRVRAMFGETVHVKYSGERPYRRAWEDLANHFVLLERGPSLLHRLETYSVFLRNILGMLEGHVEPQSIVNDRRRIEALLNLQMPREQAVPGFTFQEPPAWARPPPLPHLRTSSFSPATPTLSPVWSDDSDGMLPPVPEVPAAWSTQSPTLSSASGRTWNSNSSAARAPINHWATKVFDGKHTRTQMTTPPEPINCYGRAEHPGCVQRLMADNFVEVLRLPLDAANFYVKIYWRPSDHRARLLCTRKDASGMTTHYCIPLTALKLTRQGSTLLLWRLDRDHGEFNIWGSLSFQLYEPLLLFYSAFTALKSQDHTKYPEILLDKYHKKKSSEEKQEYAGEIQDDDFLHALRIYRDRDSGCIRLEARPRRGQFTATPIWTAFITHQMRKKDWITIRSVKTLQLSELHPYIFCPNYSPPMSKTGKFRLQFTSSKDASSFMEVVASLDAL